MWLSASAGSSGYIIAEHSPSRSLPGCCMSRSEGGRNFLYPPVEALDHALSVRGLRRKNTEPSLWGNYLNDHFQKLTCRSQNRCVGSSWSSEVGRLIVNLLITNARFAKPDNKYLILSLLNNSTTFTLINCKIIFWLLRFLFANNVSLFSCNPGWREIFANNSGRKCECLQVFWLYLRPLFNQRDE